MKYPEILPVQAQNEIEAAFILNQQMADNSSTNHLLPGFSDAQKRAYAHVLLVFPTVARCLCELASRGGITIARIVEEGEELFRQLAFQASRKQECSSYGGLTWEGRVREEVEKDFHKTYQWKNFLTAVASIKVPTADSERREDWASYLLGDLKHPDPIPKVQVPDLTPPSPPAENAKCEPHGDPAAVLAGKERVSYKTAAGLLNVGVRRVRQLVEDGCLDSVGKGKAKQISVSSLRRRLDLATNWEEKGNPRQ